MGTSVDNSGFSGGSGSTNKTGSDFGKGCKIKVTNNYTNIYRSDSKSDDVVGTANKDSILIATKISPDKAFYFLPYYDGWISVYDATVEESNISANVLARAENYIENVTTETVVTNFGENPSVYQTNISTSTTSRGISSSSLPKIKTDGVFGMPYQFSPRVDRRLDAGPNSFGDYGSIGRKYADKIIARNNILYISPGKQSFLEGCSDQEKEDIVAALSQQAVGNEKDALLNMNGVSSAGRYYSLAFALDEYYEYVNPACWAVAGLLGLSDIKFRGSTLGKFNWAKILDSNFGSYIGASNNILFYVDGLNETSEDFGNDTRESSLVSQINGYSDQVKEINYFLGSDKKGLTEALADSSVGDLLQQITGHLSNFTTGKGVLQAMVGNSDTILYGGKLVFPELWSDSNFDRSFSVNIKLRSPEADPLSIYLNIIVPFIHLMALTAPRGFESSWNGYVAPFLVRAYFRGIMNIDLGVVTGLSVTRGGEGNWTLDNLPTSMDISLTIKDLYKSMYLSPVGGIFGLFGRDGNKSVQKFMKNDGEMDYLMNLAGVDISQESFERQSTIWKAIVGGNVKSLPSRMWTSISNEATNLLREVYGYFGY